MFYVNIDNRLYLIKRRRIVVPEKCYLYDIVQPEPASVSPESWLEVRHQMEQADWIGEPGKRIGFVSTMQYGGLIAGYFANEGQKRGFQYDENKLPVENPQFSFEHLFFAIFIDTSQLILQTRNIYGYDDLGMGEMRQNFLNLTADFLRLVGINVVSKTGLKIVSSGMTYTSEELFDYFLGNPTIKIEIKNLDKDKIPSEASPRYKLYNPKDDWNPITWGAVAETLIVGTKNITLEAASNDPDAELNKGPLTKAFATIGEIEEISTRLESGSVVVRKRTSDDEIRIDLPASPQVSVPLLELILNKFDENSRRTEWENRRESRQTSQYDGTMFDKEN